MYKTIFITIVIVSAYLYFKINYYWDEEKAILGSAVLAPVEKESEPLTHVNIRSELGLKLFNGHIIIDNVQQLDVLETWVSRFNKINFKDYNGIPDETLNRLEKLYTNLHKSNTYNELIQNLKRFYVHMDVAFTNYKCLIPKNDCNVRIIKNCKNNRKTHIMYKYEKPEFMNE